MNDTIDKIYELQDGSEKVQSFVDRHDIASFGILTVLNEQDARECVMPFLDEIGGKTVVEIGAGVGYLALELARWAKRVYAIESDPAWTWTFTKHLYLRKPKNLTWIFGTAESVAPMIRADVAVIRTRSGVREMVAVAGKMAPRIVLSCCEEPVCQNTGHPDFEFVSDYIERRTAELIEEAAANGIHS